MIRDMELTNRFSELYEKPVYLYGAGYVGKIALRIFNEFGIKPIAFGDSNSALKGSIIEDISVKSLDELLNIASEKEIIIVITTMSERYESIVSILQNNKMQCEQMYTFTGFLYAAYFNLDRYGESNKLQILKNAWINNQVLIRNQVQAKIDIYKLLLQNPDDKTPVIVYQPGKVGSNTVHYSLVKCGVKAIHSHGIEYPSIFSRNPAMKQGLIECIKSVKKVKMITLVREPISKDIGHFFQKIDFELPDAGWIIKGLLAKSFQQSFLNYLSIVSPFDFTEHGQKQEFEKKLICHIDTIGQRNVNGALWGWFDEELKNNLGIDILKEKFDAERGYSIINHDNIELLVIKLEKLNGLEGVIGDFIGNQQFKILNDNVAETKSYKYIYRQFQEEVVLPREYVNFYYNDNPYTNHFYSADERAAYYEKWKKHFN
ncbi:MAG: hypothetical protein K2G55_10535 [Lachnospiraceae bacterium]|nr:hypothetical protein [Lachnospiraceae bacterium]MDE7205431.1 hypothetical protein [Lachnospiraceae bacterium]